MIRTAGFVGALAVAGAVAMLAPGTANAVTGIVGLNGEAHQDPTGCLLADNTLLTTFQITVSNETDTPLPLFASGDCSGDPIGQLEPGRLGYVPKGGSVFTG
ncbi:hypothetical protein [Nocardia callitridis]|uniref:DUF4232 domain-containing protein n=1 Tax=Nocardia callitridis TaxID=648753 RepID=A0ABP9K6V7_9NOCA